MLFLVYAHDRPGALDLRLSVRPDHLAYVAESGVCKIAGPLLDTEGKPCGSMLVIEAEDQAAAETWAASDPYAEAGLFADVEISPWNWVIGNPLENE